MQEENLNSTVENDAASADVASQEEVLSLEQAFIKLQEELEEAKQAVLYAKAEEQNARKRAFEDVSKARKFAVEGFAAELLAVKDSLEMALLDTSSVENIRSGIELTLKQLTAAFDRFNVVEVNPVGEKLDPHKHQAISTAPSTDAEPNTVIQVMQKGYLLNERILRPAMVVVASAS